MYKLIIPTYKRAETLKNKTMAYLKKTNINAKNIFIYVANKEEKELYENTIDKNSYAEIIIGKRGLPQQRNFIQKTHKIGENLFMLDDDLKSIKHSQPKQQKARFQLVKQRCSVASLKAQVQAVQHLVPPDFPWPVVWQVALPVELKDLLKLPLRPLVV